MYIIKTNNANQFANEYISYDLPAHHHTYRRGIRYDTNICMYSRSFCIYIDDKVGVVVHHHALTQTEFYIKKRYKTHDEVQELSWGRNFSLQKYSFCDKNPRTHTRFGCACITLILSILLVGKCSRVCGVLLLPYRTIYTYNIIWLVGGESHALL